MPGRSGLERLATWLPGLRLLIAYDRSWWRLKLEVQETRTQLLQIQSRLEELSAGHDAGDERERLNKEVLRLRDVAIGKDAELATALGRVEELEAQLGRYANLEQRLNDVLGSNSWRVGRAIAAPLHRLRRGSR